MPFLADAWLHNLDPFAIEIPWLPVGGIRWYGLSYLLGFALGFFLLRRITRAGKTPLATENVADMVVTLAIGIVVGGRLGYVLFYQPALLGLLRDAEGAVQFPFWGVFAINQGGMASHGGIIGALLACGYFAWRRKIPVAHMIDLAAFGTPIGLLLGRIANFINGELYGRACDASFALAVKFPQEAIDWLPTDNHPMDPRLIQLDLFAQSQRFHAESYHHLVFRAIDEVQAGNPAWSEQMALLLTPRYPSQLFAGFTEGIVVMVVLLILYRRPVRSGIIGGAFCIVYALMRILNEQFRMPDAHLIENGVMPAFTRGQYLSIGLLVFGTAAILYSLKTKQPKLGGWLSGAEAAGETRKDA